MTDRRPTLGSAIRTHRSIARSRVRTVVALVVITGSGAGATGEPATAGQVMPHGRVGPDASDPRSPSDFVPEWSWPLPPTPAVLRFFERPPQKWKPGHRGVDLSTGGHAVPMTSPADGTVSFAGTVVDRGVLSIDHGGGRVSSFEPVSTELVKGQPVVRGETVATVAVAAVRGTSRSHCGGICLHWGVRVDGEYVDPLSFVTDRRPSVLLPLRP
ncbi:M23 family metallopeptidase [Arthrobacter cheniae]|nr:M23 family metallopeptidase [Arthrobacter cheniae]